MKKQDFVKNITLILPVAVFLVFGFAVILADISLNEQKSVEQIAALQRQIDNLEGGGNSITPSLTEAVARVAPSVVSIVATKDVPDLDIVYKNPFGEDPQYKDFKFLMPQVKQKGDIVKEKVGAGTGFFVSTSGYIVTNKHVVSDDQADYTVFLADGDKKSAKVVYLGTDDDIAVVKIDGSNYPTVTIGDSTDIKLGQHVFAVGNALGEYDNSVSVGIISGLNRTVEAFSEDDQAETLSGVIQTDAAINMGNSGGPLSDLTGRVIGINVATVMGSNNISFALPINSAKKIIESVVVSSR